MLFRATDEFPAPVTVRLRILVFCALPFCGSPTWAVTDQALLTCAAIESPQQRLNCYDELVSAVAARPAGPQTAEPSPQVDLPDPAKGQAIEVADEPKHREWLAVRPYKSNYVLPLTYSTNLNEEAFLEIVSDAKLNDFEAKYQLSIEADIWPQIFGPTSALYFGYTQLSFWQLYNSDASSPFRETNYEPEVGLALRPDFQFLGFKVRDLRAGFVHQSNGQGEPLSRSWNRIFASVILDKNNFSLALRPWYRVPEKFENDDNPDIEDFLGNGELYAAYRWRKHTFGGMLRNNLDWDNNRGALQLDWTYPLTSSLKAYLQYFHGYGESLIDYDNAINRLGLGFAFTEWP